MSSELLDNGDVLDTFLYPLLDGRTLANLSRTCSALRGKIRNQKVKFNGRPSFRTLLSTFPPDGYWTVSSAVLCGPATPRCYPSLDYLDWYNAPGNLCSLESCTKLEKLILRADDRLRTLDALRTLRGLEFLAVTGKCLKNIAALRGTGRLAHLDVSGCTSLADLGPVACLPSLRTLHASRTKVGDLAPINACTQLTNLCLAKCRSLSRVVALELPNLVGLEIGGTPVETLQLRECRNLQILDCDSAEKLSSIELTASVQTLNLDRTALTNLSEVARQCPNLQIVSASYCPYLQDVGSAVRGLQNLVLLEAFEHHANVDVRDLASCPRLAVLRLSNSFLVNTDAFKGLQNLSELYLVDLANIDMFRLDECTAVQTIYIDGSTNVSSFPTNALRKLSARRSQLQNFLRFGGCTRLAVVDASICHQLKSLAGLESLKSRLRHLDLAHCPLTDFSELRVCSRLEKLNLTFTAVRTLDDISQCRSLRHLNLSHTLVENLRPLQNCRRLTTLLLDHCHRLASLRSLGRASSLQRLSLVSCVHLEDVSALRLLPHLKNLTLDRCSKLAPAERFVEVLGDCQALQVLSVRSTYISDVTPLSRCPKLSYLDLSRCVAISTIEPLKSSRSLEHIVIKEIPGPVDMEALIDNESLHYVDVV